MKKLLAFLLATAVFVSVFAMAVQAVSARNSHTILTGTSFTISADGKARVALSYEAYDSMTSASIHVVIKKRTFLFFWDTIINHTFTSTEKNYTNTFIEYLTEEGTYKCEVEYVISGTGGEDDVIPFEDTATY